MPVSPRDAATVVLARPGSDGGYEVLLTLRPESMEFMGGTYVFPGGMLDQADHQDAIAARSTLTREQALERLGEDIDAERALGLFCCGLREVYEEVGVLLAHDGDRPVDPARVRNVYAPHHVEVGHDASRFASFLATEGLRLATDELVPHGRLITPERAPIRFDARFFVAKMPEGQAVLPNPIEVPDYLWITPAEAVGRSKAGELEIPIPTMAILQGLAEIGSFDQLFAERPARRDVEVTRQSPLVSSVLAPNPGLATGAGTNTYVVGTDEVVIIDPAVADPVFIERVAWEAGNRGRAVLVLLTHLHPDHIGGVAPLAEQMGCEVAAWEGADAPYITRKIADEEIVEVGDLRLRAMYTPGHESNHLCYLLEEEERSLFAGDVVAGYGTVVIAPPDGNMGHYMQTLERLRAADVGRIFPGHGPVIEDGNAKLDEYIAHRREREEQVLAALAEGLGELPEMVAHIYTDVPEALHAMAQRSVLAHLEALEDGGRVRRDGDAWSLA